MREAIWPWTGAVLVVAAVVLVVALPRPEVLPPQFRVTYPEEPTTLPGGTLQLKDGGEGDLPIDVAGANLTRLVVTVQVQDDLPASDPDRFELDVRGPDQASHAHVASATPAPETDGQTPPGYRAPGRVVELVAVWAQPPREGFVDGAKGETPGMVGARVASQHAAPPATQWSLHVLLASAGACPGPTLDAPRAAACHRDSPTGVDAGNPVVVTSVRAYHYHAVVTAA